MLHTTKSLHRRIRLVPAIAAILLSGAQPAWSDATAMTKHDMPMRDHWSPAEIKVLSSLRLNQLPPVPADPSNAAEGLPAAVELGRKLFQDARLSAN